MERAVEDGSARPRQGELCNDFPYWHSCMTQNENSQHVGLDRMERKRRITPVIGILVCMANCVVVRRQKWSEHLFERGVPARERLCEVEIRPKRETEDADRGRF